MNPEMELQEALRIAADPDKYSKAERSGAFHALYLAADDAESRADAARYRQLARSMWKSGSDEKTEGDK